MSKVALNSYLRQLEKELRKSGKTYRTTVADRRAHHFRFTTKDLVNQTLVELNDFRDLKFTAQEIAPLAEKMLPKLRQEASRLKNLKATGVVRGNQHYVYVYLVTGVNPRTSKGYSIFQRLKTIYKKGLDTYAQDLNKLAKEKNVQIKKSYIDRDGNVGFSKHNISRGSDLFEGGHEKQAGVFESRVRDVIEDSSMAFLSKQDALSRQDLLDDLALLGIDLSIFRNDMDDSHTITIESKIANRLDGLSSADNRAKILKELNKAIMKLPAGRGLENLKGSDSIGTKKRKKLGKKVTQPFKAARSKRVTVKTEDFSIKSSSSKSTATKKIKSSVVANKKKVPVAPLKVARAKASKSTTSLTHLVPLLNQRLPEVVAANMGDPRLNNVTGRFASSVRVTEIARTTQGFPSIGYTYQKSPYQTFEQGGKQGSRDKDPRSLIDASIRELAVQYALGRFYTRRV